MIKKLLFSLVFSLGCLVNGHSYSLVFYSSFNGTSNDYDLFTAVARDSSNNYYAVGCSSNGANDVDGLIRKYNSSGVAQWTVIYNSSGTNADAFTSVAVDTSNNVVVVGYENRLDNSQRLNAVIRKYNSAGTLIWSSSYNSVANGLDLFFSVAIDTSSNIWAVGVDRGVNALIQKYDSNGNLLLSTSYNSPASSTERFNAVTIDTSGYVYTVGYESRPDLSQSANALVAKYDSAGLLQWTTTYNSSESEWDEFTSVVIDTANKIVVAGSENLPFTGQSENFIVKRYDLNGLLENTTTYNSPTSQYDRATGVVNDSSNNIHVIGLERNGAVYTVRLIEYNSSFTTTISSVTYSGDTDRNPMGIVRDGSGNIIIVGAEGVIGEKANGFIRKYTP